MTVQQPQRSQMSDSDHHPPTYDWSKENATFADEKHDLTKHDCQHTASQTPYIDAALKRFPSIRDSLLTLSAALANIASEKECTKCATESATFSLVTAARDIKMAKKSGGWSKEDRKATKKEVKGLFKGMNGEVKELWKKAPESR